jgi:PII-like signaling protein
MSHRFKGERTLMRIFIGEADKCKFGRHKGRPLYEALLNYFREREFAGATVLRGVAGFGAHSRVHTDKILRLSLDLPVIIEVVAREERIQECLPDLDQMIDGGLITLERVRVILYRAHDIPEDERFLHRIDGLQDEQGNTVGV